MVKKTLLASAAIAALVTIGGAGPGWALPVLEFSSGTVMAADGLAPASAGWSFTTNQAVNVTALDAFDPTGTGAGGVRLYNASGAMLASATVTTSDPKEGSPISFYSAAITPVSLAANTTYYIAEDLASTTMAYVDVTGLTTPSEIKYGSVVAVTGLGMNPTSDATMGMFSNGVFGPNFDIGPAVPAVGPAVPEPASLMLLGVGLLGWAGAQLIRRREMRNPRFG